MLLLISIIIIMNMVMVMMMISIMVMISSSSSSRSSSIIMCLLRPATMPELEISDAAKSGDGTQGESLV